MASGVNGISLNPHTQVLDYQHLRIFRAAGGESFRNILSPIYDYSLARFSITFIIFGCSFISDSNASITFEPPKKIFTSLSMRNRVSFFK